MPFQNTNIHCCIIKGTISTTHTSDNVPMTRCGVDGFEYSRSLIKIKTFTGQNRV